MNKNRSNGIPFFMWHWRQDAKLNNVGNDVVIVKKHLMNPLFVVPLETHMINTGRINQQHWSCWWSSCWLHSCYNRHDHRCCFSIRTSRLFLDLGNRSSSIGTFSKENKTADQLIYRPVPFRSLPLLLTLVLLNKDIHVPFSPPPKSLIAGVGKDRQTDTQAATWFHFDIR